MNYFYDVEKWGSGQVPCPSMNAGKRHCECMVRELTEVQKQCLYENTEQTSLRSICRDCKLVF